MEKLLYFQIEGSEEGEVTLGDYEVVSIESQTEIDRKKSGLSLSLSPSRIPPQNIQTPNGPEDESGTNLYVIHKECNMFDTWHDYYLL